MALKTVSFWGATNGTWLNVATVLVGGVAGILLGNSVPSAYPSIILQAFGLLTLGLGVDACVVVFNETVARYRTHVVVPDTYGARLAMVMVMSLALGSILGTGMGLNQRLEQAFASWESEPSARGDASTATNDDTSNTERSADANPAIAAPSALLARGFVTAFVLFCVGPLTLLGCLRNGLHGDPGYLQVKSVLDGFSSMALASKFGLGVMLSVPAVGVLQGGLSLLAWRFSEPLPDVSLRMMTSVGGVLMLGTGISILEIADIPVANMIPALFLPPALIALAEIPAPGYLLPRGERAANDDEAA